MLKVCLQAQAQAMAQWIMAAMDTANTSATDHNNRPAHDDDPWLAFTAWLEAGAGIGEATGTYDDCKLDPITRAVAALPAPPPAPITWPVPRAKAQRAVA